jgi:hypothetical protein
MERRIEKKIDIYSNTFKNNIKSWLEINNMQFQGDATQSEFLQYIFDYDSLHLCKEDFQKRKRVKNVVPHFDRCTAKRASGEQCTRRKKTTHEFCGTHVKGIPHGKINNDPTISSVTKIEVWIQEIKGIDYYIDNKDNVYKPEDIIVNKVNPRIIAKYKKIQTGGDTIYTIPSLGL